MNQVLRYVDQQDLLCWHIEKIELDYIMHFLNHKLTYSANGVDSKSKESRALHCRTVPIISAEWLQASSISKFCSLLAWFDTIPFILELFFVYSVD